MDDRTFMKQALALAEHGRGFTAPNPMVGAVVVKDGRVIGRGFHEAAGKAHAEINAIADAGPAARGATLYVTLEPCNHTGRTPPCTDAIIAAGIAKVVVAMTDPNPDVIGGGAAHLKAHGVCVHVGTCRKQAERLNEVFVKYARTKRPFVTVKCAATLDGRIATRTGDSKWVTGEAARAFVHRLRHAADAILVGVDTIKKDDPRLTTRIEGFKGKDPRRIILDTRLTVPEQARIFRIQSDADTLIITGPAVPVERRRRFQRPGVRLAVAAVKDGRIDLPALMADLGADGITSVLVEGGARVIASALHAAIVDKIVFFYAPKILGGDDGVPICRGTGPEWMRESIPVGDLRVKRFGEDVMIEGYIKNG